VVGAVLAWVLFAALLTHDGGLLHRDVNGNFYDAQADALLHGHWNVDPAELSLEGFAINGKVYTYFGPVPAIARMPIEAITHRFHGRLTRLSMLLGEAVLLAFAVGLVEATRRAVRDGAPVSRFEAGMCGLFVFAAGTSSTLFLAGKSWIYHEDLLWGAALSVGSLTMLGSFLVHRRRSQLVWACVLAALALLTRASVGAGPIAALVLAGAVETWRGWKAASGRRRESLEVVATMAGAVIGSAALYAAVNYVRFGTLFSLPIHAQVLTKYDTARQAALAANHNSLFGLKFVPTQVVQSLRPDALDVTRLFPFVDFPAGHAHVLGDAVFATLDPTSSIPASEPLLFLLALAGLVALLRPRWLRAADRTVWWRIPVLAAAVGAVGYLAISYVANRYFTDLLPFLLVAGAIGLHAGLARIDTMGWHRGRPVRGVVAGFACLLALFGVWVNAGLGLTYHYVLTPGTSPASRAKWATAQLRVDKALHGDDPLAQIVSVSALPEQTPRGQIAIVGDCDAMYRSDGGYWRLVAASPDVAATLHGNVAAAPRGGTATLATKAAGGERAEVVWRTLADGMHRMELVLQHADGSSEVLPSSAEFRSGTLPETLALRLDPYRVTVTVEHAGVKYLDLIARPPGGPIEAGPGLTATYASLDVCHRAQAKLAKPS
jgi:hypothetical protein